MNVKLQKPDPRKHALYVIGAMALLAAVLIGCGGRGGKQGTSTTNSSGQDKPPAKELWTKTNTPEWVGKLPPEVKTAFSNMMNDQSPLYTGIFYNSKSTKVYINRSEWKELNKFQATNHLTLAAVLPHTDDTVIEYLDDKSGEKLATFTAQQNMGSIKVVHP